MRRFTDIVVDINTGAPVAGAMVTILLAGTAQAATLFSTNDVSSTPINNPMTTDQFGEYTFFTIDGEYDIRIDVPNEQPRFRYDVQVYDLSSISGSGAFGSLNGSPDTFPYFVDEDNVDVTALSANARQLLAALDFAAMRSSLGIDASTTPYRGDTVQGAIDNGHYRKPRRIIGKMWDSAADTGNETTQILIASMGDSLSTRKSEHYLPTLDRAVGGQNSEGIKTTVYGVSSSVGLQLTPTDTVNYTLDTNAFDYWITGSVHALTDGGEARLIVGGADPIYTKVMVLYVKEPGAGSVQIEVDGVAQGAPVSASIVSGKELGILEVTQGSAVRKEVKVLVTGGTVRFPAFHFENLERNGVIHDATMGKGGLLLSNATADGLALVGEWLAYRNYDQINFEMDDDFGDGGTSAAAFIAFADMLDSSAPLTDKVMIGSTPRLVNDAGKIASGQFLRAQCAVRGSDWSFFDSYNIFGSYQSMVDLFGSSDGVHPPQKASYYAAVLMFEWMGLSSSLMPFSTQGINAAGTASALSSGTYFIAPQGGVYIMGVDFKDGFGDDWSFTVPKSLAIYDDNDILLFRISNNQTTTPNVLPVDWRWGAPDDERRVLLESSAQRHWVGFRKYDNATGYMGLKAAVFTPKSDTFANVQADFNANSSAGSIAWFTDGVSTAGAGPYVAHTNGSSDWRKNICILPSAPEHRFWSADTGTADKGALTTFDLSYDTAYVAPTISATYDQAQVQALADALATLAQAMVANDAHTQALSRRAKAVNDMLTECGLIRAT